jgi:hypothetical protein
MQGAGLTWSHVLLLWLQKMLDTVVAAFNVYFERHVELSRQWLKMRAPTVASSSPSAARTKYNEPLTQYLTPTILVVTTKYSSM